MTDTKRQNCVPSRPLWLNPKKQTAVSGIPPLATTMQREDEPRLRHKILTTPKPSVFVELGSSFVSFDLKWKRKVRKKISTLYV